MPEPTLRPIKDAPISVVLIAYNTGSDLDEIIATWVKFLEGLKRDYEIILVDDGSNDGTAAQADLLAQQHRRLRVLHHDTRHGIGASLRTGIAHARLALLFYTTCDKQYQPKDLPLLFAEIDKVDIVVGYRVWRPIPNWVVFLDSLYRVIMRVLLGYVPEKRTTWLGSHRWRRRLLARVVFAVRTKDPVCLYCLCRREIFPRIPIQSDGPFAQYEILAKANFLSKWLSEVPVSWLPSPGVETVAEDKKKTRREIARLLHDPDFGPVDPRQKARKTANVQPSDASNQTQA